MSLGDTMFTPDFFDSVRPASVPTHTVPAIITNSERGVYFGWIKPEDASSEVRNIRVFGCRNCYYWDTTAGIGQLVENGPGAKAKIGAPIGEAILGLKANVFFASVAAAEKFAEAVWYNG